MSTHNNPFNHCAIALSAFAAVALAGGDARADHDDESFELEWSTYIGGDGTERDAQVAVAGDGSVFIVSLTDQPGPVPKNGHEKQWDTMLVRFDEDGDEAFTTFFGGDGTEYVTDIKVHKTKAVVVVGATTSAGGIAENADQDDIEGNQDGFIAMFDEDGELKWSTYVGGDGDDAIMAMALNDDGDVYVCGTTDSTKKLATDDADQQHSGGKVDAFIAKYSETGELKWSTYLGGAGDDGCTSIALQGSKLLIGGFTDSDDGIATKGAHKLDHDEQDGLDGFVARFNVKGDRKWGTYYGGEGEDFVSSVAFDFDDDIYIAGETDSMQGISTDDAHQDDLGGDLDLFVGKLGETGKRKWGTYYGGEGLEADAQLVVRKDSEIYLAGQTGSNNKIVSGDVLDDELDGEQDLFLVKFSAAGERRRSTYFGGENGEMTPALAVRGDDTLYLAGTTNSEDLMLKNAYDSELNGEADVFLARLDE